MLCRAQASKHVCQLHVVVCFGTNRACGFDVARDTATRERLHETLCQISAEADFFFPMSLQILAMDSFLNGFIF